MVYLTLLTKRKASNGMYVLRLDSDDWIDNNCLQILSMFLDNYKDFDYVWPDYNLYIKKKYYRNKFKTSRGWCNV